MSNKPIVIDNGTYKLKVGFSGDLLPTDTIRSVVSRFRCMMVMIPRNFKDVYTGEEAISKRMTTTLKTPIECGIITNWDDYERTSFIAY